MLIPVFLQGFRFDLVLLGLVLVIPTLLFPVLASSQRLVAVWRAFLLWYLPAILVAAVFMELSTPSFVMQFDSRPNIMFVEYLGHPREVFSTLWAAYKLPLIFALFGVAAVAVHMVRRLKTIVHRINSTGPTAAILILPVLLALCFGLIRSTIDHRPVNPSTVALSNDPLVNDLALNSLYTVLYAIYETRHESQGGVRYGLVDDDVVFANVRASMNVDDKDFSSTGLPTLHVQHPTNSVVRPKNLVIIVEESLGAEFVGSLGGLELTPNLDELAGQGIWFNNLYATGTRSVRGLEAIVSGFTPTPARSVVKLPKSQRNFFTLARLLSDAGYETSFIYGGESQFDNMRRFFMNNGFDRVIDEKNYAEPVFAGSWGVSDEDLFSRAHAEFSAAGDRPFFSLVFTSSNHSPFQFPDGRIDLVDQEKNTVSNAVKYADYALGRFFRTAKESAYWNDTIFLVVADHNSRVYGSDLVPVERFHVPALILGGAISPSVFEPVASQIDLPPTLLSLIGIDSEHPMIGHDLSRSGASQATGRAIMQFNGTQAYMEGDQVIVMRAGRRALQMQYIDGHLAPSSSEDTALIERAVCHALWSSIAYDRSLYRLPTPDI
jgi:phosphoglycerol transferase MdoB-like AlkP superfamily enzyme